MSLFLFILLASYLGFAVSLAKPQFSLDKAEYHFENFIKDHNRTYVNQIEREARFLIFKKNLEEVIRKNEKSKHAVHGITQFMDLTLEEFEKHYTCFKPIEEKDKKNSYCPKILTDADIFGNDAPESFDWRDQDVVTPIKHQLGCAACYAFSAIGNLEGQYAKKHKNIVNLSEQQIVDCDHRNNQCSGGIMAGAFITLMEEGGSESEDDYPYTAQVGQCKYDKSKAVVKVTDCRNFNLTSQEKLKQLLYKNGPIAIGIKGNALMTYTEGILTDEECDSGDLNHAVLLVGYGSEDGHLFWIVKNSWGLAFGEKGYFRMHRGEGANSCSMMNPDMTSADVV